MKHLPLRFKLHRQCQDMLETYRRDGGIGQSALESYQRTAEIQTQLRNTLYPPSRSSRVTQPPATTDVAALKMAALRMRTTASPRANSDALVEVA